MLNEREKRIMGQVPPSAWAAGYGYASPEDIRYLAETVSRLRGLLKRVCAWGFDTRLQVVIDAELEGCDAG